MELTLSTPEQARLGEMTRALLSPLDHEHTDAWRSAVCRSGKALLGADVGSFVLPIDGKSHMYSEEFSSWVTQAYPNIVPRLPALSVWHQQVKLGVWCRATLYGPFLEEYFRTEYYNEYITRARAFDSIGITVPLGGEISSNTCAGILFHHEREGGAVFGDRGVALLRLLKPAFEAGVHAHRSLGAYRGGLIRLIDATGQAILLVDVRGKDLHRTPELEDLLSGDPWREQLLGEMRALARRLLSRETETSKGAPTPTLELETRCARYRVLATPAEHSLRQAHCGVLVCLERTTPRRPTVRQLQERLGLTRRQADVALQLAEGRSNAEIARNLFISPYTARRHTEKVLLKLDAHSRAEVASRLDRLPPTRRS